MQFVLCFIPDLGSGLFWVRLAGPGGALSKFCGFVGGSGLQKSGLVEGQAYGESGLF